MTDLNITERVQRKSHTSRTTLRVDMTPMVDLGFLLISFFIFTTQISKPSVTKLFMPHGGDPTQIPETRSLTILVSRNHQILCYPGRIELAVSHNEVSPTTFDETSGLGKVIRDKQFELEKKYKAKKELIVVIKPGAECSYGDVVRCLDEMLINNVSKYVIADLDPAELSLVEATFQRHS